MPGDVLELIVMMPAVDSPTPGGLSAAGLELLLGVVLPHCYGIDVCIFDPDLDSDGQLIAIKLAARLRPSHPQIGEAPWFSACAGRLLAQSASGNVVSTMSVSSRGRWLVADHEMPINNPGQNLHHNGPVGVVMLEGRVPAPARNGLLLEPQLRGIRGT